RMIALFTDMSSPPWSSPRTSRTTSPFRRGTLNQTAYQRASTEATPRGHPQPVPVASSTGGRFGRGWSKPRGGGPVVSGHLRIIPLGGLGEIGLNMLVLEMDGTAIGAD